jgi:hypothetical protein
MVGVAANAAPAAVAADATDAAARKSRRLTPAEDRDFFAMCSPP